MSENWTGLLRRKRTHDRQESTRLALTLSHRGNLVISAGDFDIKLKLYALNTSQTQNEQKKA